MPLQVLVVEDDSRARMLLATILRGAGYAVVMAASGEDALALLAQQQFGVVITDIRMGAVDGLEVVNVARAQPEPPAVILLTGYGSLETAIAGLRAGAHDYLLKPAEPAELLECVARAAQRYGEQQRQATALQTIHEGLKQLYGVSPAPPAAREPSEQYVQVGDLTLDTFRHAAQWRGEVLHLTRIEYTLLRVLAEAHGRVIEYSELVRSTHGHVVSAVEAQLLLKAHVRNLRRKIDPDYLINVRGAGYLLTVAADSGDTSA